MAATPDITTNVGAKPFTPVQESGLVELIGINEQVDQNDYSGSAEVSIASADKNGTVNPSGEILAVTLISTEDGSGAIMVPACELYIFDADPAITSGDTTISADDGVNIIGTVKIAVADWIGDTTVKVAHKAVAIPFHALGSLFFSLKNIDATAVNSAAGDDEQIEMNSWYRRDS